MHSYSAEAQEVSDAAG